MRKCVRDRPQFPGESREEIACEELATEQRALPKEQALRAKGSYMVLGHGEVSTVKT